MKKSCSNCNLFLKKIENTGSVEVIYVCSPEKGLGVSRNRLANYFCDKWEEKHPYEIPPLDFGFTNKNKTKMSKEVSDLFKTLRMK